ncbi:MAG: hypothetical protein Aurels2KO_11930 [Aureliella sp.]
MSHRVRAESGAFDRAAWNGLLQIRGSKRVQFHVLGKGTARVVVDGVEVISDEIHASGRISSQPIQLKSGLRDFTIEFQPSGASQFGLYWSSDQFSLEPVPSHLLWHESGDEPQGASAQDGAALSRGLRCAACHEYGDNRPALPAPDLTHLSSNLRPSWLVSHLAQKERPGDARMPGLGLHLNDAAAISAALFAASQESSAPKQPIEAINQLNKKRSKKEPKLPTKPDAQRGNKVLASVGCLACHSVGDLARPVTIDEQMFGGGDLAKISTKRTPEFFLRWLDDPSLISGSHRMPKADLSAIERWDVATYLATLGQDESRADTRASGDAARGVGLVAKHRCAACHKMPTSISNIAASLQKTKIDANSNFDGGCLTQPDSRSQRPGYSLSKQQRESLRLYIALQSTKKNGVSGERLLAENNCIACHSRDGIAGISKHMTDIVDAVPELAGEAAALSPPSLTSIGDKLHESALDSAIKQSIAPLRPWLAVRMPKFDLPSEHLEAVTKHLVAADRLPNIVPQGDEDLLTLSARPNVQQDDDVHSLQYQLAAGRLVTADGFGCQSCHAIGSAEAPSVDLKARGPNLSMLGKRVRADWFYRWVRNPARIVPRMEMPAIQNAARGLLDDSLDKQLDALWTSLNDPDFVPPKPNPTTVVRASNTGPSSEPIHVLTDVFEHEDKTYLRPIVIGLHNRQNVMIDLERAEVAMWWSGDTAFQRTRGKTWYWEPATPPHGYAQPLEKYVVRDSGGAIWRPTIRGQVAAQLVDLAVDQDRVKWSGTLHLQADDKTSRDNDWLTATITQTIVANNRNGFDIETVFSEFPKGAVVAIDRAASDLSAPQQRAISPLTKQSLVLTPAEAGKFVVRSSYEGEITDQFLANSPPPIQRPAVLLRNTPGFAAQQLPLPTNEMPISFAWSPDGEMFAGSLKGNVLSVVDSDGDGLEDVYRIVAPNFPSPYGMIAGEDYLDVLTKFGLLRLSERSGERFSAQRVLADDWGYTHDYHDWAVGLERDQDGSYYIAIPCQQDDRSEAAARRRGTALKLVPSQPESDRPRFVVEEIAAGLRFPMGIALSETGELFTSDNQGNYNPFNEINHVRQGKRYGFINKLEQKPGFSPPFESPAINLPHPWTRSVNGICFLYTPSTAPNGTSFGPFEGHMIGCEMNGRSLIRMSLQKVGDTYQGAAYPLSIEATGEAPQSGAVTKFSGGFEGPIVCEVSPSGDVYVGSLQDSGWGGGQNTGSVVRLRPVGNYPLGIAEVRATPKGFNVVFTKEIPPGALDAEAYSLRSYQRISTPVYGGDDKDSQRESVLQVQKVDERTVHLELGRLREGFVYEIQTALVTPTGEPIFPAEAHYTMRSIPTNTGAIDE